MNKIKAIEKLRSIWKQLPAPTHSDELLLADMDACIKAIEAEIAERYMELPVDADGVPIRLGDVMDGVGMYDTLRDVTGEVIEIAFNATDSNECVPSVALQVWSEDGKSWRRVYIDQYAGVYRHHVKPRTLEDVLTDMCNEVALQGHQIGLTGHEITMKYAAEIRELMGVGE